MLRIKTLIRSVSALGIAAGITVTAAACGSSKSTAPAAAPASGGSAASELRLGYFANVTHATAVVGVAHGDFATALGATQLSTQVYNAGPAEMTALLSDAGLGQK